MLKRGDKVVMHTCLEAEAYNGKVWTCGSDEFKENSNDNCVWLEGFSSKFCTEFLQKVNINDFQTEEIEKLNNGLNLLMLENDSYLKSNEKLISENSKLKKEHRKMFELLKSRNFIEVKE
ncbi:hypothetical protein FDF69_07865 [Clostridium sporogenes]|uniref:hypothetical protein n=1 Tax=Clostridium sporogenes TaxID=1509 RepID=UPI0006682799|nr:hypothetical protein [Clostridium sporogenes]NFF66813.1 hypothetical protein [Clostridium sporogenes]NFF99373.1 hypothetical protein [Clostridium sporogenes]NFG06881.1 hypothetical protein [Clostridium sporogenes]NFG51431.1 hypothetical protein [Clostridium sporogenes]NFP84775.1 hypothetical protein [Clostridium sporogenes]